MMAEPNIVFIVPTLGKGGLERVATLWANELIKMNFKVTIILIIPNKKIEYSLDPRVKLVLPTYNYNKGISFKFKSFYFLYREIKRIRPTSILGFGERFNPLSIMAARLNGISIFISDRSSPILKKSKYQKFIRSIIYPMASGILAQTKASKEMLYRLNSNILVLPNPLRQINDDYTKLYDNYIISVGRLIKSKNFGELIEIFYEINKFNWKLIIIGEGPERNDLEKLIIKLDLKDNVFLKGRKDDIDRYLARSSIFAFTSLSEGFPNALSEAIAFPLASISYNCVAGPSDLIENEKNGVLIPLGEKEKFKKELQKLMESKSLRLRLMREGFKNRKKYSRDVSTLLLKQFITIDTIKE